MNATLAASITRTCSFLWRPVCPILADHRSPQPRWPAKMIIVIVTERVPCLHLSSCRREIREIDRKRKILGGIHHSSERSRNLLSAQISQRIQIFRSEYGGNDDTPL